MNFVLNVLLFCSLGWNLEGPKTRNCSFDFHVSSIFKIIILWNYRLEFFWKNLRRNCLVKIRFPLEIDLVYVRSIFFALCAPLTENIAVRLRLWFRVLINVLFVWKKSCVLFSFLLDWMQTKGDVTVATKYQIRTKDNIGPTFYILLVSDN